MKGGGSGLRAAVDTPTAGEGRAYPRPVSHERGLPGTERRDVMAPQSTCSVCSYPMLLGAYRILDHGEMVHLACGAPSDSVNRWPEGTRHLFCLSCDLAFESDSKVRRRCKACRAKSVA